MSKAPFYNVFINDEKKDITNLIDKFKYEDCLKEDDFLYITINPEFTWNADKNDEFKKGQNLFFEFGYLSIESSGFRTARISDINPKYGERITLAIKALDKGNVMKKTSSSKVWKNKSTKQIVEEIASTYGMTAKCDIDGVLWKSKAQGLKSDWNFLQEIVGSEKDGDYVLFCRDNVLYFTKIGITKKSRRTFTYGDPDSKIISFEPENKDSTAKKSGLNTTMVSADPMTQKPVKSEAKTKDTKEATGSSIVSYLDLDVNKQSVSSNAGAKKEEGVIDKIFAKFLPQPPMSEAELKNKSKAKNKKHGLKNYTAKLKIEGDPTFRANEIITMNGVLKREQGNWLIVKAIHEITGSGYITTLELEKNGSNHNGDKKFSKETAVNKTTGPDKSEPKKKPIQVNYDVQTQTKIK